MPESFFINDEELEIFLCMAKYRGNYMLETVSLIPVNQAVFDALVAGGNGVFVGHVSRSTSLSECGG
jgi:hypothetical protein